jgi:hypothetical protein
MGCLQNQKESYGKALLLEVDGVFIVSGMQ